jgi:hypothetical protein
VAVLPVDQVLGVVAACYEAVAVEAVNNRHSPFIFPPLLSRRRALGLGGGSLGRMFFMNSGERLRTLPWDMML